MSARSSRLMARFAGLLTAANTWPADVRAKLWLSALLVAGVLESLAALVVHRPLFAPHAWDELKAFAHAHPAANVVIDGTWLVDTARAKVPQLFTQGWVEPHANAYLLRGVHDDGPIPPGWQPRQRESVGSFALIAIEPEQLSPPAQDWLVGARSGDGLVVRANGRPCRWQRGRWVCEGAQVRTGYAEVGYVIHDCLLIDGDEGVDVSIERKDPQLHPRAVALRGAIGKSDFNAALRNESPLALRVQQDGSFDVDALFDDHHGLVPWRTAVDPQGQGPLRVSVLLPALRTWQENGQVAPYAGVVCLQIASEVEAR